MATAGGTDGGDAGADAAPIAAAWTGEVWTGETGLGSDVLADGDAWLGPDEGAAACGADVGSETGVEAPSTGVAATTIGPKTPPTAEVAKTKVDVGGDVADAGDWDRPGGDGAAAG